jgi:predicted nucleic-acid-binding Zn-ribbon protein
MTSHINGADIICPKCKSDNVFVDKLIIDGNGRARGTFTCIACGHKESNNYDL